MIRPKACCFVGFFKLAWVIQKTVWQNRTVTLLCLSFFKLKLFASTIFNLSLCMEMAAITITALAFKRTWRLNQCYRTLIADKTFHFDKALLKLTSSSLVAQSWKKSRKPKKIANSSLSYYTKPCFCVTRLCLIVYDNRDRPNSYDMMTSNKSSGVM